MAEIRVRVGQQNAVRIASTGAVTTGPLAQMATDVDTTARANRTFLMYDSASQSYIHVPADQILDLADNIDDESYDAGTF